MKQIISSKVLSVQVFVVLCLVTLGSLISCYVTFGRQEDVHDELLVNPVYNVAEKSEGVTRHCEPKLKNILM